MYSKVKSCAVAGVDGRTIMVEADVHDGLPMFTMVGYLSSSVKEAAQRVQTALKNSGYHLPAKRITVNLSPADLKKDGSGFDLSIAVAVLLAMGIVSEYDMDHVMILGELSLDGSVRPIRGVLPMVNQAAIEGCKTCIVPKNNTKEAALVRQIEIIGVDSLLECVEYLQGIRELEPEKRTNLLCEEECELTSLDFSEVKGQESIKRGMEIAAAGFHNVLLCGPAGAGKSMLVKRLPGILPKLTFEEQPEVTKIYSVGGKLNQEGSLIYHRPFRSPHHTITEQALVGGGRIPGPGEVSFAHMGVLFLDELPEFQKHVLEVLREPLEERKICISRLHASYEFPADFMMVAAMNPCPCGNYPGRRCQCTPKQIQNYQNKISGPLLDRIDIRMEVRAVGHNELFEERKQETSKQIRKRVEKARRIQQQRFANDKISFNSQLDGKQIETYIRLDYEAQQLLEERFMTNHLSMRGLHRVLRLARTIADLEDSEMVLLPHLQEAFFYRNEELFTGEVRACEIRI